jgi:hypothetical protein
MSLSALAVGADATNPGDDHNEGAAGATTEPGWGGSMLKGVQCRLLADRLVWKAGEIPTFKAHVKDLPIDGLSLTVMQSFGSQIEVDGTWYKWSGLQWIMPRGDPGVLPDTHRGSDWIAKYGAFLPVVLAGWLWTSAASGEALNLRPGKHTVRLAWAGLCEKGPARLLSNLVQIEIPPSRGRVKNLTPQQNRRRQVLHAFHTLVRSMSRVLADPKSGLGTELTDVIRSSDLYPAFGWDDIPILLELAESKREIPSTPALQISSSILGRCFEGMAALWLVEGLRRRQLGVLMRVQTGQDPQLGYYDLPLNAVCYTGGGENGKSTAIPSQLREGVAETVRIWWERARSDCGQVHRKAVQAYQDWWGMVGSLPPEQAAAFHPFDLTDISWDGRDNEPLETYDQITPEGAVARRSIHGYGRLVQTVYYTLKKLKMLKHKPAKSSSKADYKKETMAVQKVVLYFYDDNGSVISTRSIYPGSGQP